MTKNQTTNASAATTAQKLNSPFNLSHPDSRCSANNGRRHKFYEVRREQVRRWVFRSLEKCKNCGGEHSALLDYTVTSAIFSI